MTATRCPQCGRRRKIAPGCTRCDRCIITTMQTLNASRTEQDGRYLDSGPGAWDDRDPGPDY